MRLQLCSFSFACSLLFSLALPHVASAQTADSEYGAIGFPHHSKISLLGVVGMTGKATLQKSAFTLDPTYGFEGRYEHPINTYLVFGVQFGLTAWVPTLSHDLGSGRSTLIDLAFLSKLRYPFSERFEVYVVAPLGFCVGVGDSKNFGGLTDFAGGLFGSGLFGAHIGVSPSTGLVLEGGYALHMFKHEVAPFDGSSHYHVSVLLAQPWFMLGFYART